MPRHHTYEVSVAWTGNRGSGTSGYRDFSRDHQVAAEGREPIEASSEPLFRGDPARWNPELELTAALSQCHMLWYLHLCAASGVVVTSYADEARGAMEETDDGSGQFTEVVLRPRVTVSSPDMVAAAVRLHEEAHSKCFIARSVNFGVRHEPVVTAEPAGVARLTSLQVHAADLAAAARFYGQFIGLELSDEPHRHDGNEALHYDLAWGDPSSADYLMLHLAQAEPGQQTTGAQIGITVEDVDVVHQRAAQFGVTVLEPPHDGPWGRCATYKDPDGNTISVTMARRALGAGQVSRDIDLA
jgi:organic hydroperoxide reductase OsmC/OhrA/predicted enzyme related to lactoylglutathione lyase